MNINEIAHIAAGCSVCTDALALAAKVTDEYCQIDPNGAECLHHYAILGSDSTLPYWYSTYTGCIGAFGCLAGYLCCSMRATEDRSTDRTQSRNPIVLLGGSHTPL
uniref:Uncharacterized protein n=1 Tax=Anopheles coluzzii TaxID=1518534 RepID=A0A8W7P9D0_ANOCL